MIGGWRRRRITRETIPYMKRLLALSLLATSLVGCFGSAAPTVAPNVTAAQQINASKLTGLSFPAETQFLLYYRASDEPSLLPAPDDAVQLKIELPASAAAELLAQAPLSSAAWESHHPLITDQPTWPDWRPSKIRRFRFAQFQLPKAQVLSVLIDDDRDDIKVVYLEWFET
jgi:hypothetical protein